MITVLSSAGVSIDHVLIFICLGCATSIPTFPIPLRPGETEPTLPLNHILHELYDQGGYDLIIDYRQPPQPPLSEADAAWARQLVAESVRT